MSDEARFLHDIINPLSIAHAKTQGLVSRLQDANPSMAEQNEFLKSNLDKIATQLDKAVHLIKERQHEIKKS